MKRIEQIKNHLHTNKKIYLSCGVTAVVSVVGTMLVHNHRPEVIVDSHDQIYYCNDLPIEHSH